MKVLLTGITGYIAQRLLPILLQQGHTVYGCARDPVRFRNKYSSKNLILLKVDFLKQDTLVHIPLDIDIAYYLIHSMSTDTRHFSENEEKCALHFNHRIIQTQTKQVIYLGGIANQDHLSKHLLSRKNVETILRSSSIPLTSLRAGIIIGSGSASFEIIRDLVEKLPVMVAPKWLNTKSQPIAIRNVLEFLTGVLGKKETFHQSYDIGGPEILTYKEMLLRFAKVRRLKRYILTVPVMSPKISSYWLYFITSTSFKLASNLVNSMKIEVVCKPNHLAESLGIKLLDYSSSIRLAFDKIEQNDLISSWKDASTSNIFERDLSEYIEVPVYGCFRDKKTAILQDPGQTLEKIWRIGGKNGWYYADWLWEIRGILDQLFGGVGLRRGRRSPVDINSGDTLDFWRVIIADRDKQRLLLYAEMKLPGEAWLEFVIGPDQILTQTATFRPLGLWGRLYWYSVLPFHYFIFNGLIQKLSK